MKEIKTVADVRLNRRERVAELMALHLTHEIMKACAQMPARRRVLGKILYALRKELQR